MERLSYDEAIGGSFNISSFGEYDVFMTPESKNVVGVLKFVNRENPQEVYRYLIKYPNAVLYKSITPSSDLDKSILSWISRNLNSIALCGGHIMNLERPTKFSSR